MFKIQENFAIAFMVDVRHFKHFFQHKEYSQHIFQGGKAWCLDSGMVRALGSLG